jgi:hypothetical protein
VTSAAENRQRLFDNDVMVSWLAKIDNLNDTECLLFRLFLANKYGMKIHFCGQNSDIEPNRISAE